MKWLPTGDEFVRNVAIACVIVSAAIIVTHVMGC
jgi:hypothetical protein